MIHKAQFLTTRECDELLGARHCFQFAAVTGKGVVPEVRLVQEAQINDSRLERRLDEYVAEVLTPLYSLPCAVTRTTSLLKYLPGFYFKRHVDFIHNAPRRRLVSLSIGLDADYEGGELVLYGEGGCHYKSTAGSLIAFPSTMVHEVKPIKSGVRHAIVVWITVPNEGFKRET
jgi:predicted 2-oxoglutarate/Fe(II)-dependent dioxygenase YbiX